MPHTPVSSRNRTSAKTMRATMTEAELKLWIELRAHRLMGLGFRRQLPIAGYIVDFAWPGKEACGRGGRLAHAEPEHSAADAARTARLEQDGWTLVRFWNDDILRDIDGVCQHIVVSAGPGAPRPGTSLHREVTS